MKKTKTKTTTTTTTKKKNSPVSWLTIIVAGLKAIRTVDWLIELMDWL